MGLQPGVRGGGGASITALGDVMSRWPGATEGPVPPRNNPSFHPRPTSALQRPRLGGHTGLVKQREEEEGEWWTWMFHWQDLTPPLILMESHLFKLGVCMNIICLTISLEEGYVSGIYDSVNSTYRDVSESSICQQVYVRREWQIHKYRTCYIISNSLSETGITPSRKKNLFSIPSYSRAWQV